MTIYIDGVEYKNKSSTDWPENWQRNEPIPGMRHSVFSPEIPSFDASPFHAKLYYRLDEAAQILGCTREDLLHYAGIGKIRAAVFMPEFKHVRAESTITKDVVQSPYAIELLTVQAEDCRRIEQHHNVSVGIFMHAWTVEDGFAVQRWPEFADRTFGSDQCRWGLYSNGYAKAVQSSFTEENLLFFGFDIKALISENERAAQLLAQLKTAEAEGEIAKPEHKGPGKFDWQSEKLWELNQAAQQIWKFGVTHGQVRSYPTNERVAKILQIDYGFTETMAQDAARIIRPEWAPKGRPVGTGQK